MILRVKERSEEREEGNQVVVVVTCSWALFFPFAVECSGVLVVIMCHISEEARGESHSLRPHEGSSILV